MTFQTFELANGSDQKNVIGYISKTVKNTMVFQFKGFWGTLFSEVPCVNVDDFVGSIFGGYIICAAPCAGNLTVIFDSKKYAASVEIRIYHPVAGLLFSEVADVVRDVTDTVRIPYCSDDEEDPIDSLPDIDDPGDPIDNLPDVDDSGDEIDDLPDVAEVDDDDDRNSTIKRLKLFVDILEDAIEIIGEKKDK